MTEEELQEQQEHMQAAAGIIIIAEEEARNFKEGGRLCKEAAETYRAINEKTVQEVSQALLKRPVVVVSQEQLNRIEQTAERGARRGVSDTQCSLPSPSQMIPIIRDAMNEVGPEVTYKRVIKGKKWFWIGILALAASIYLFGSYLYQNHTGTKEAWANRNYVAAVELEEKNPGEQYHKIIELFDADHEEEARNIVLNNEVQAKDHGRTKRRLEKKLKYYLSNEENFDEGIVVLSWEKERIKGKTDTFVIFQDTKHQGIYRAWIDASGYISITMDEKVTTLKSVQKYSHEKIWRLQGNINVPYKRSDE